MYCNQGMPYESIGQKCQKNVKYYFFLTLLL